MIKSPKPVTFLHAVRCSLAVAGMFTVYATGMVAWLAVGAAIGVATVVMTVPCPEHPDRLAEQAQAWQLSGMWRGVLADSLACTDHPVPYMRPVHAGEDDASDRMENWMATARAVDLTP